MTEPQGPTYSQRMGVGGSSELLARAWDEGRNARPTLSGADGGHREDCAGWEDCHCGTYVNPYLATDVASAPCSYCARGAHRDCRRSRGTYCTCCCPEGGAPYSSFVARAGDTFPCGNPGPHADHLFRVGAVNVYRCAGDGTDTRGDGLGRTTPPATLTSERPERPGGEA